MIEILEKFNSPKEPVCFSPEDARKFYNDFEHLLALVGSFACLCSGEVFQDMPVKEALKELLFWGMPLPDESIVFLDQDEKTIDI